MITNKRFENLWLGIKLFGWVPCHQTDDIHFDIFLAREVPRCTTQIFLTERKPFRVYRFLKESIKLFYFFVSSGEQTFDNREQCTCFRVDWKNHQTLFDWIFIVKPWKTDIAEKIYRNRWHWKSNRIYRDTCFQAFRKQLFHC